MKGSSWASPTSRYGMLGESFSMLIAFRYAIPSEYLRDTSKSENFSRHDHPPTQPNSVAID
ncbi:hypothetical protein F4859DRAFT_468677 [Xylaria cf. heliscus]|nr:hypothetical protein F4859DRAFT_468677 [Xylaria cf. heliscus]